MYPSSAWHQSGLDDVTSDEGQEQLHLELQKSDTTWRLMRSAFDQRRRGWHRWWPFLLSGEQQVGLHLPPHQLRKGPLDTTRKIHVHYISGAAMSSLRSPGLRQVLFLFDTRTAYKCSRSYNTSAQ